MCGRFVLIRLADFTEVFPWASAPEEPWVARYNIAPSQPIPAVINDGSGRVVLLRWGLVPSWAKDESIGNRMINARAETLGQKPAFRTALRQRRCIIPASGFYEWAKSGKGGKTPMFIRRRGGRPMALAGLWETWRGNGSELRTCTIITVPSNSLVGAIHDRMPAIVPEEQCLAWLDPTEQPAERMMELLRPYPAEDMEAWPVDRRVNRPGVESPDLIEPVCDRPWDEGTLFGGAR